MSMYSFSVSVGATTGKHYCQIFLFRWACADPFNSSWTCAGSCRHDMCSSATGVIQTEGEQNEREEEERTERGKISARGRKSDGITEDWSPGGASSCLFICECVCKQITAAHCERYSSRTGWISHTTVTMCFVYVIWFPPSFCFSSSKQSHFLWSDFIKMELSLKIKFDRN